MELILLLKQNPAQFAAAVGISRTAIQHILSGRNEPSLKIINSIIATYPAINVNWLIKGEGSAFEGEESNLDNSKDYPLFADGGENRISTVLSTKATSFSTLKRVKEEENQVYRTDNKPSIPTIEDTKKGKRVKEVIIMYDDGTFEKILNNAK